MNEERITKVETTMNIMIPQIVQDIKDIKALLDKTLGNGLVGQVRENTKYREDQQDREDDLEGDRRKGNWWSRQSTVKKTLTILGALGILRLDAIIYVAQTFIDYLNKIPR